ncbi:hypothetical protein JAO76_07800 [Pontibacter sp. BT310]|uniref:Uncharacterized protein n=1 Tax=Pontibacter populi TaxID=890055 RepID=A0ABS6XCV7_9BACT|nr:MULTISPECIES: hypothetical protein [Pontibacter]MBJ6118088.1 hypothetical protein [Pontibacter sp. BT310]MBR0570515.1 hypothetical protein [Microvirga sp. STS03]MBW3364941.1 hypothetical protein [Pontibacter populi]
MARKKTVSESKTSTRLLEGKHRGTEGRTYLKNPSLSIASTVNHLAQGNDIFNIEYSVSYTSLYSDKFGTFTGNYYQFQLTWNEIFGAIAPTLANGEKEKSLIEPLNFLITKAYEREYGKKEGFTNFCILKESFHTILIQMRALGLINEANEKRKFLEDDQYWKLTKKGDELMLNVRSIRKPL